jgi:diacylglycerol O-acyltransferase 2, plant
MCISSHGSAGDLLADAEKSACSGRDGSGASSPTTSPSTAVTTLDCRALPRTWQSYLSIWLLMGSMWWHLMFLTVVFPALYFYKATTAIAVWCGILVAAALLPSDRKLQPGWCFAFGAWVAQKCVEYFRIVVVVEDKVALEQQSGPAIFAIEPHDILPLTYVAFHPSVRAIPGHTVWGGITSMCFLVPFLKHMYSWVCAASVDKQTILSLIREGISPLICPGGVQEVMLMDRDDEVVLYLKNRLGFVKLALQQGIPIVPVFSFGLRGTFDSWLPRHPWVRSLGRKIGFMPLVFFGIWGMPFAPAKPTDYTVVVGKPILCPKMPEPSVEDIRKYHGMYVAALTQMFEEGKAQYGMKNYTLRVE